MSPETRLARREPGRLYRVMMGFVGRYERWVHQSCRTFIQRASASFERPLTPSERIGQATHRLLCSLCRVQERRLSQLGQLAHEVAAEPPAAPGLSSEARERIREAMRARQRGG
jgi:hypothetical protein